MQKIKDIAHIALLVCGCIFLLGATMLVLQTREVVATGATKIDKVVDNTNALVTAVNAPCPSSIDEKPCGVVTQLTTLLQQFGGVANSLNAASLNINRTMDTVNRPCGTKVSGLLAPDGTLCDFTKTMNTARLTMGQIEVAANHEDKNLTTLDAQETQIANDMHNLFAGALPVEDAAADATTRLATLAQSVNDLINSPQVKQTLTEAQAAVLAAAGILQDGKIEADKFIAPTPWFKRDFNYLIAALRVALCAFAKVNCTV
jgi:hypothetical protein